MLTDIRTNRQSNKQSHKQTLLKTLPPWLCYAAWVLNTEVAHTAINQSINQGEKRSRCKQISSNDTVMHPVYLIMTH